MPKAYVTPNVNDDLQARLQSITQQILSRTRLLHIIDQLNLYADQAKHLAPDEKVDRMRKDIEIELVRDGQRRSHRLQCLLHRRRSPRGPAGDQRADRPVHQREPGSAPATVGGHHQVSGRAAGDRPASAGRPGRKDPGVQGAAHGRVAHPAEQQPANPDRTADPAADRTGRAEHCQTAARLPADAGRPKSYAAGAESGQGRRRSAGRSWRHWTSSWTS